MLGFCICHGPWVSMDRWPRFSKTDSVFLWHVPVGLEVLVRTYPAATPKGHKHTRTNNLTDHTPPQHPQPQKQQPQPQQPPQQQYTNGRVGTTVGRNKRATPNTSLRTYVHGRGIAIGPNLVGSNPCIVVVWACVSLTSECHGSCASRLDRRSCFSRSDSMLLWRFLATEATMHSTANSETPVANANTASMSARPKDRNTRAMIQTRWVL